MILTQPANAYEIDRTSVRYNEQSTDNPARVLAEGTEVTLLKYDYDGTLKPEDRQYWALVQHPRREEVVDGTETRFAWVPKEWLS